MFSCRSAIDSVVIVVLLPCSVVSSVTAVICAANVALVSVPLMKSTLPLHIITPTAVINARRSSDSRIMSLKVLPWRTLTLRMGLRCVGV